MKIKSCVVLFSSLVLTMQSALTASGSDATRIYFLGNSLTDQVKYEWFEKLSDESGVEVDWSRQMIPGAPIRWLFAHPDDGFRKKEYGGWQKALSGFEWDVLTFQPFAGFDEEVNAAVSIAGTALAKSPQLQIYWYAQWPGRDGHEWADVWNQDFRNPRFRRGANHSRSYYEAGVQVLRERLPDAKPVLLIPVGHVMYRLDRKMSLGLVPGFSSIYQFYADGIHLDNVGSYVVANTFYAVIHKKSPVGLPVDRFQQNLVDRNRTRIDEKTARLIQETIWEEVTSNPFSGVNGDIPVAVGTLKINPAVSGSNYSFRLLPAYGKGPYKWRIAYGSLPEGLVLTPDGFIQGTSAEADEKEFALAVTDATGRRVERTFSMQVNPDTKPVLVAEREIEVKQGAYTEVQLEASSNNPPLSWMEKKEKRTSALPVGMELTEAGLLYGTPGIAGTFKAEVQVTDGDSSDPEESTCLLSVRVLRAGDDVTFVRKAPGDIKVDGRLDPSEGWHPDIAITKTIAGKSDNTVLLDLQWSEGGLYWAIQVRDAGVHFKRQQNAESFDSMEIFIDAENNREKTFNVDDRHAVFIPDGTVASIGSMFDIHSKFNVSKRGYTVEGKAGWWTLGTGNGMPGKAMGFDVIVNDSDDGKTRSGRLVWHGSATNHEDPGQYRTVILVE